MKKKQMNTLLKIMNITKKVRMTKEEINQKTSLCFLLNPNISEDEKNCVIEKVMATKATIVPKAALCNIITYILKQNAELKEKLEDTEKESK